VAVLAGMLGATLAAGCASSVSVEPVRNPPAACTAGLTALPDRLAGHDGREVSPLGAARAYGNPPIVVRCGVDRPPGYDATQECFQIDDVGWYTETAQGGTIFTSVWARPRVEVRVPSGYTPTSDPVVDATRAVQGRLAHPGCPS